MRESIYIILMVVTLLAGCRKDVPELDGGYIASNDMIDFNDNTLTRNGTVLTDDNLEEIEVYAYYTPESTWVEASSISDFMTAQKVTKDSETKIWSYSPAKYWPASTDDHITFFAFSPCNAISASSDEETSRPQFSYTIPALAIDGYDLVGTVARDENIVSGASGVNFELQHLLTKIMIKAQITQTAESTYTAEKNDKFVVNGVVINAYSEGVFNYDYDEETETWVQSWTPSTLAEITATQNNVLLSKDDAAAVLTVGASDATYIMKTDEAIFVMPQDLTVSEPTIQLRVRRSYDVEVEGTADAEAEAGEDAGAAESTDEGEAAEGSEEGSEEGTEEGTTTTTNTTTVEIIYETEPSKIPTDDISEWVMGDEIALTLAVDIDNLLNANTPLAVTSEVFWYSDTTVEVDMHSNLYIYSSLSDIVAESDGDGNMYGDFMVCTNYDYNLRVPHHRVELDGEITSSRGFVFCSEDFNGTGILSESYTVGELGYKDYEIFLPTLLDKDDNEVVYVTKDNLGDSLEETTVGGVVSYSVSGKDVYFDNHDFAYHLKSAGGAYDLDDDEYVLLYTVGDGEISEFEYNDDGEIDLTKFETTDDDGRGTVNFKIKIGEVSGSDYEFDFSVTKSTREIEKLYYSTAIEEDGSYGVNKAADDPVYILRLSVNEAHLEAADGVVGDGVYGKFDDIIGVKMISNGGGVITQLFSVTLSAPESN